MFAVYNTQFGISGKLLRTTRNFTYRNLKKLYAIILLKNVDVSEPLFARGPLWFEPWRRPLNPHILGDRLPEVSLYLIIMPPLPMLYLIIMLDSEKHTQISIPQFDISSLVSESKVFSFSVQWSPTPPPPDSHNASTTTSSSSSHNTPQTPPSPPLSSPSLSSPPS